MQLTDAQSSIDVQSSIDPYLRFDPDYKSDDEIIKKYGKYCPSCDRNCMLPYEYENTCYFCHHTIIKTKKTII